MGNPSFVHYITPGSGRATFINIDLITDATFGLEAEAGVMSLADARQSGVKVHFYAAVSFSGHTITLVGADAVTLYGELEQLGRIRVNKNLIQMYAEHNAYVEKLSHRTTQVQGVAPRDYVGT